MVARAFWETAQPWCEVELVRDLLGDWVAVRRWGSKASRRYRELSHVVAGEVEGWQ
jgi:hypothetical protein